MQDEYKLTNIFNTCYLIIYLVFK